MYFECVVSEQRPGPIVLPTELAVRLFRVGNVGYMKCFALHCRTAGQTKNKLRCRQYCLHLLPAIFYLLRPTLSAYICLDKNYKINGQTICSKMQGNFLTIPFYICGSCSGLLEFFIVIKILDAITSGAVLEAPCSRSEVSEFAWILTSRARAVRYGVWFLPAWLKWGTPSVDRCILFFPK